MPRLEWSNSPILDRRLTFETGRLRHDELTIDGSRRYDYRVVAAQVEFLGKKAPVSNGDVPDADPATAGF